MTIIVQVNILIKHQQASAPVIAIVMASEHAMKTTGVWVQPITIIAHDEIDRSQV